MIRYLAAALLLPVAVLAGCTKPVTPDATLIKTIHPDGTVTCALKQDGYETVVRTCPPDDLDTGWATTTVTAPPTP